MNKYILACKIADDLSGSHSGNGWIVEAAKDHGLTEIEGKTEFSTSEVFSWALENGAEIAECPACGWYADDCYNIGDNGLIDVCSDCKNEEEDEKFWNE